MGKRYPIRHVGVSEVVKDAGAGSEYQIRERLPGHAEARSEIVFLRMPQGRARRSQCHGCQIVHCVTVNGRVPLGDEGAALYSHRRP